MEPEQAKAPLRGRRPLFCGRADDAALFRPARLPGREAHDRGDVSAGEVLTLERQRLPVYARRGIGGTVAIVQPSGVPTLAEMAGGPARRYCVPVFRRSTRERSAGAARGRTARSAETVQRATGGPSELHMGIQVA